MQVQLLFQRDSSRRPYSRNWTPACISYVFARRCYSPKRRTFGIRPDPCQGNTSRASSQHHPPPFAAHNPSPPRQSRPQHPEGNIYVRVLFPKHTARSRPRCIRPLLLRVLLPRMHRDRGQEGACGQGGERRHRRRRSFRRRYRWYLAAASRRPSPRTPSGRS